MYGLIGKNIGYSFSKAIHNELGYEYEILDVDEDDLDKIMLEKAFLGLNVTIPYKQKVIEYLDELDPLAKSLNAVNTIVNQDGKLYGYNTDYAGLKYSLESYNVDVLNKQVLILGSGNSAQMTKTLMEYLKAKTVTLISRTGEISYENLSDFSNYEIIINTTPVGVYPNVFDRIIDLNIFNNLEAVIDLTYNPLNTKLILDGKAQNVNSFGGLKMLVAQAVFSSEYFFNQTINPLKIAEIYETIKKEKENIVLIGMPTAGKSVIGTKLAKALNRELKDLDQMIVDDTKKVISDIFSQDGEQFFRMKEASIIHELAPLTNIVIASGGGSILDVDNVNNFKLNGKLVFINRPLELLQVSDDRPLSDNQKKLENLYAERLNLYRKYADFEVINDKSVEQVVNEIIAKLKL